MIPCQTQLVVVGGGTTQHKHKETPKNEVNMRKDAWGTAQGGSTLDSQQRCGKQHQLITERLKSPWQKERGRVQLPVHKPYQVGWRSSHLSAVSRYTRPTIKWEKTALGGFYKTPETTARNREDRGGTTASAIHWFTACFHSLVCEFIIEDVETRKSQISCPCFSSSILQNHVLNKKKTGDGSVLSQTGLARLIFAFFQKVKI